MDHFGLDTAQLSSTGPVCDAEEDTEGSFARVQLICGDGNDLGEGNLHVTTKSVPSFANQALAANLLWWTI